MKPETIGKIFAASAAAVGLSIASVFVALMGLLLMLLMRSCESVGHADARGMADRTAEEIRWDVLREIDGQMERGGATGRFGNGVAVHGAAGSAGILPAGAGDGAARAGAAKTGAQAGGTPTPPSGAPGGCVHVTDHGGE